MRIRHPANPRRSAMNRFRRILLVTGLFILLLGVTSPLWLMLGSRLAEPVIRSQLIALADEYLEPRLELGPIRYGFPLAVSTTDAKLVAKDEEGKDFVLLSVKDLRITLHRLPIFDGPLVFQELMVVDAEATFEVNEAGQVTGWETLLRDSGPDDADDDDSDDDDRPISDLFAIDRIGVEGLDVEYRIIGNPTPMIMKDLIFEIDNKGRSGAKKIDLGRSPGWYEIDTDLKQGELLDLAVKGGIDIDTLDVELTLVKLDLQLDETRTSVLPPQIQSFIKDHQVEGSIDATLKGEFNLDNFMSSRTRMSMALGRTRFAIDKFLIEIDEASATGRTENDTLLLEPIVVKALDGTLNGTIRVSDEETRGKPKPASTTPVSNATPTATAAASDPPRERPMATQGDPTKASPKTLGGIERAINVDLIPNASLRKVEEFARGFHLFTQFQIDDMQIQALHRIDEEEPHRWAGTVDAAIASDLNLASPLASLEGGGSIGISKGRLSGVNAWQALAKLMRVVTLNPNQKDRANLEFTVDDERVDFQRFNMLAGAIGVRAKGWIGFDRNIHIDANAGPLEALQDSAGTVGSILGSLTDRLVKYVIRGRIGDPTVRIAPLGIHFLD
ncbi:MAG: hypothetical protein CMJ27_12375 [Phycisphaerae bacterium]|nr:hypothetical protein [Phycisphaerae bacterium]OUX00159.1 MAG: hypothetical protein CBD91_07300 [Phycisphaeraceae bacterium TMED231]